MTTSSISTTNTITFNFCLQRQLSGVLRAELFTSLLQKATQHWRVTYNIKSTNSIFKFWISRHLFYAKTSKFITIRL